jgi:hypothetical protein
MRWSSRERRLDGVRAARSRRKGPVQTPTAVGRPVTLPRTPPGASCSRSKEDEGGRVGIEPTTLGLRGFGETAEPPVESNKREQCDDGGGKCYRPNDSLAQEKHPNRTRDGQGNSRVGPANDAECVSERLVDGVRLSRERHGEPSCHAKGRAELCCYGPATLVSSPAPRRLIRKTLESTGGSISVW